MWVLSLNRVSFSVHRLLACHLLQALKTDLMGWILSLPILRAPPLIWSYKAQVNTGQWRSQGVWWIGWTYQATADGGTQNYDISSYWTPPPLNNFNRGRKDRSEILGFPSKTLPRLTIPTNLRPYEWEIFLGSSRFPSGKIGRGRQ